MLIPIDESKTDKPNSVKKGEKKRLKGYQREEDLTSIKRMMTEINKRRKDNYTVQYNALR